MDFESRAAASEAEVQDGQGDGDGYARDRRLLHLIIKSPSRPLPPTAGVSSLHKYSILCNHFRAANSALEQLLFRWWFLRSRASTTLVDHGCSRGSLHDSSLDATRSLKRRPEGYSCSSVCCCVPHSV